MDRLIRYEDLKAGLRMLDTEFGIRGDLPHDKDQAIRNHMKLHTPESKNFVRTHFSRDFELFGYQK